jgi:hypothetical protein
MYRSSRLPPAVTPWDTSAASMLLLCSAWLFCCHHAEPWKSLPPDFTTVASMMPFVGTSALLPTVCTCASSIEAKSK